MADVDADLGRRPPDHESWYHGESWHLATWVSPLRETDPVPCPASRCARSHEV